MQSCLPNSVSPRCERKECLLSTAFINIPARERKKRRVSTLRQLHPCSIQEQNPQVPPIQIRQDFPTPSSKRSKDPTSQISDWAPVKPCHLVHRWDCLSEMHGLGNFEQGFPSSPNVTSWHCNQHDSLNWESPTTMLLASYRLSQSR